MLEVLDPEQNSKFTDHYLGTPFDLSKVFFIATANNLDTIHPALLDRMEIIDISGYSLKEKIKISENHLVPKQLTANGLNSKLIFFDEPALKKIVNSYTAENGVWELERKIGGVCWNVAYQYAISEDKSKFKKRVVDEKLIKEALGGQVYDRDSSKKIQRPG